jgi:YihY family inner membrane protein
LAGALSHETDLKLLQTSEVMAGLDNLLNLNQSKWWQTLHQARTRWVEVDGDQCAAAFGYYLLLSLLPIILLLVTVGSFFVERAVAAQAVVQLLNHNIPLTSEQELGVDMTIRDWLSARGRISLAALPLLLWGSLKFLRTLVRTTNRVWHANAYNWWRLPIKSLALLGITASAVLIGILLPAVAGLVRRWLALYIDFPQWPFAIIYHLIPGLVLFYGMIMIYRLAPRRPTQFSEVWQGALAAAVLIWLGQRLFLVYTANLANFNVLYGALGGIVAFLLWLYLSSCVGVFGICFCAAQADVRLAHVMKDQESMPNNLLESDNTEDAGFPAS